MSKAARQTWDSPGLLTEDESIASTPQRHLRERRTGSRTPRGEHSLAAQRFELNVGALISPKKIRVTAKAGPEYATRNLTTQRPISSSSGSGVRLSPAPYYSTPFRPRAMKVKTTTVPLRGLSDSEAEKDAPMPVATPARGRGRPRKSAATPIPTKGKRIGTPAAKIAKTRIVETPGTKSRRLSDLLHTGGSSGDNSEEWDFNIPQQITTGRGRSESRPRVRPYDGRDEEERASSEVPMSSRANKRGQRIGVGGTPSGFGFSYKKPKIGQSRLRRLDFGISQLGREERRSSESIVEPDQADVGFGSHDDSSRPSTADSLLNGRHVSSSPPNLGGGNIGGKVYPAVTSPQRRADRRQSMGYQEFSFAQYDDEDLRSPSVGSAGAIDVVQTTEPPSPPHTESPAQESDGQWIKPSTQEQWRVSPPVPAHRELKQSTELDESPKWEKSPKQQYFDQASHSSSPEPAAKVQRTVSPQIPRQAIDSPQRHKSPEQQYYDQDSHSSSPATSVVSAGIASTAQTSQRPPSPLAHNYEDEEAVESQGWSHTQSRHELPRSPLPGLASPSNFSASYELKGEDREESSPGGANQPRSPFVEERQYYDPGSHSSTATPTQSQRSSHSRPSAEVDVPFPSLSPERLHQQIQSTSQSLHPHHTQEIPLNVTQNNSEHGEGQAFDEFDTIIENEDFTMITTNTMPSLLQFFTSPLDPNEQAEIRAEIAAEEVALAELHEEETELARLERELAAAERREEIARRRMRASGFQDIVHETIERSVSREIETNVPNDDGQEHDLEFEDGQDRSLPKSQIELPRSPPQTQEVLEENAFLDYDPEAVEEEERNSMLSRNEISRSPIPVLEGDLPTRDGEAQQEYYDQKSHSSPAPSEIQDPGNEDDLSYLSPPPAGRQIPQSPPQTQDVDGNNSEKEEQDLSHLSPPPARRELPRSPPQTQDIEMEVVQDEQEEQYDQDWSLTQSRHKISRSPLPGQPQAITEEVSFLQRREISREPETVAQDQDKEQDWSLTQSRHEIPRSPLPGQAQEVVQEMAMEEAAVSRSSALLTSEETPSQSRADITGEIQRDILKEVHEEAQQENEQDFDIWALEASTYNQTRASIQPSSAPPEKPAAETLSPEAPKFSWKRASKASAEPEIDVAQEQEQKRSSPVPALKRSLQSKEAPVQMDTKASSPVPAQKRSLQQAVEVQEQPVEEVGEGGGNEDVWMAEASAIHPDPEPAIEHLASPIPKSASPPKHELGAESQKQPQTIPATATVPAAAAITKVTPALPPTPVFKRSLQRSQVEIELEEVLQKARKRRSGLPEDWMRQSQGSAFGYSTRTSHSAFDITVNHDDSRPQAHHYEDGNASFGLTIDGTGEERPSMIGDASILRRETRQREAEERKHEREAEAQRIRELAASKEAERQRRKEERELERRKRSDELEKELQREREEREAKREAERKKRREERESKRDEEINREREERYKCKLAEDEKKSQKEELQRKAEEEKAAATEAARQAELRAQQETQRKVDDDRIAQEAALKAQAEAERQAGIEAERLILEAKRAAEREEARVAELRKQRDAAKQRKREEHQAALEAEQRRIAQENEAQRLVELEAENTRVAKEQAAQRDIELRQEREAAKQRRREESQAELEPEEKMEAEERETQKQVGLRKEREIAKQRRREGRQAELEDEEQRQAEEREALGKAERRQEMDKENVRLGYERAAKRPRLETSAGHLRRPLFREPEVEQSSQKETGRQPFKRVPTTAQPISHKVYDHGQETMSTSYALSPLKASRKENDDEENPFRRSGQGKRTFEPRDALVGTKESAAGMPKPDFLFDPPSRFMKGKVKEDFKFDPPTQHPLKAFAVSDTSRFRGDKGDLFRRKAAPTTMVKGLEMEKLKLQKPPALRCVMKSVEFDPPYSDGLRTVSVSEEEVDVSEAEVDDKDNPFMTAERSVSGSVDCSVSRSVERSVSEEESRGESERSKNRDSSGSVTPKVSRDLAAMNDTIQQGANYSESEECSEQDAECASSSSENIDVEALLDAKMHNAPSFSGSASPSVASQQSRSSQYDSDDDKENQHQSLHEDDGNEDEDDVSMVDVEEGENEDPFSRFSDSENEIVASTPMPPRGPQAPMRQPLRTVKPQLILERESPKRPYQRRRPQIEDSDEDSETSDQSQGEEEESQIQSQSESEDELEIKEEKQRQESRSTASLPHAGFRTGTSGAPKSPLKSSLRHPPPLGSPRKNVVFSATTAISPESSFRENSQVNEGLTAAFDRLIGEDSNSESGSESLSSPLSRSPSPTPSVQDQQSEDEEQPDLDDRSHFRRMTPYDWSKRHWKVLLSIKNEFESDPSAEDDIPHWIQNSPYVDETIWGAEEDGSMDLVVEPWMVYVAQLFIETLEDKENGSEDWREEMEEVIKRVYGLVSVERKCAREGKRAPWATLSERVRTFQEVKKRTVERLDKEGRWVEIKPERRGFFGFGTAWL